MNVPIKKGALLRHHGHLYFVEEIHERHSGQMKPAIHLSLRDAADARHIERTLDQLMPLEEVPFAYRTVQYLYHKGEHHFFMDSQSFEEIELPASTLGGFEAFLKEGEEFRVLFVDDTPLRLEMPESIVLAVADTAAPVHAVGASGSVLKEARLENGLSVRVPLFIKTGDHIHIDTRTRQYTGKAHA